MPVNFIEQKNRQKKLLIIVLIMFVASAVVLWFGYFRGANFKVSGPAYEPKLYPENSIIIDFQAFENPFLKSLQPFPEIPLYEGELGKENPFK